MRKITLIENNNITTYSKVVWDLAWLFVFAMGIVVGYFIHN
jgi:hypothetical protein